MEKIISLIMINIFISIVIYLLIAFALIIIDGKPKKQNTNKMELAFDELVIDYSKIPELSSYLCRDGNKLNYRYYPSQSNIGIVFIHGSGWHSKYFYPLAAYISSNNIAKVYTPDLRGHGINPNKRGDINYINQLEDDLADFISFIKKNDSKSKIILAGHSSGGGLVIRFAGRKYSGIADAYLLLSPYLKYNAPTMKLNAGGWASVHIQRIVGLSMLNNIGISLFNFLNVIDFNMPKKYRDGTETLSYSYRLNTGFAPHNYKKELKLIDKNMLIIVGKSDESFNPEEFYPEISKYKNDVKVKIIDGLTHMGVVIGKETRPIIRDWINSL